MLLKASELKNLPVFTKSGTALGFIVDWEMDSSEQIMARYIVARGKILGRFVESLLISREQVIFIDKQQMTVDDAVLKEKEKTEAPFYESSAASS